MKQLELLTNSAMAGHLSGQLELLTLDVPDYFTEAAAIASAKEVGTVVLKQKNLIVSSAQTVLLNMLMRNLPDYLPYYIGIGDGGDLDQDTKEDTGARVAPALADTEIRSLVTRVPITMVDPINSTSFTYVAAVRPFQALTASLNELTLETFNNTLISHFVTAAAPSEVTAQKYVKSSLNWLIIRWTLTFTVV